MPESDSLFDDLALRRELSANLVGFCRYLRLNGLPSGIGEQMDALRALEEVDLKHETAFKMALRTTLAKSTQEQEIFDEHYHRFWYIWESAENLSRRFKAEKEEPAAVVVDARPKKESFMSIGDWLGGTETAEEDKEAAGYSPFETESERDFSSFRAEELSEVMHLINEIGKALATRFSRRTINSKKTGTYRFTQNNAFKFTPWRRNYGFGTFPAQAPTSEIGVVM